MDAGGVALYMSATVLGGALAQWPVGLLSDKMDRRWRIMGLCRAGAAIGLALGMFPIISHSNSLLLSLAYGLSAFPLYVVCLAHTNDYVSREEFVEVSSGLLLVFAGGAALGPLFAAGIIELTGVSKLYAWTAVCHIALGGFALNRIRRREAVPESERSEFSVAMEAAQTVSVEFQVAAMEDGAESDNETANGRMQRPQS